MLDSLRPKYKKNRTVAKTRCILLEYGQSKVQGRTEYN